MPEPKEGEERQEFISRCMSSEEAKNDFPDQDQRVAFCINQFERMSKTNPTSSSVHVPSTERDKATAEFDGKEVELEKPFRLSEGSSKKFGVYVKDGDEVKRITFGDSDMEIKRDDPEARANFRARFNCDEVTDKTSATFWSCKMWQADTPVSEILDKSEDDVVVKRQLVRDKFTTRREARIRSRELGLGGHTHQHTTDNGAIFMPGRSHKEYVMAVTALEGAGSGGMFKEFVEGVMKYLTSNNQYEDCSAVSKSESVEDTNYSIEGQILKVDEGQKIIYGWASVITEKGEPVVDTQGDIITSEELVKAVNDFMEDDRTGKLMHTGDRAGTIIHSFPITNDIAKALGLDTDREGWIVGYKPNDPNVIEKVKSGELTGFSIGGNAQRIEVDG